MKKPLPWRFQTDNTGQFDELVLGEGENCVHLEMMDDRHLYLGIGLDWQFSIFWDKQGRITVNCQNEPEEQK